MVNCGLLGDVANLYVYTHYMGVFSYVLVIVNCDFIEINMFYIR